MPDKEHEGLARELGELGSRIEYPPTPDVARTVRRRIDAERPEQQRDHRQLRSRLRAFARPKWVAAAATLILLSLTILSPATRSTVSDSVSSLGTPGDAGRAAGGAGGAAGAGGAGASGDPEAQYAEGATTQHGRMAASDGASAAASSGASSLPARPPGAALGLGEELPESEARARVDGLLLPETPELTGERGVIYAGGPSEADGVVLVFGPDPGLPPLGDTDVGLLLAEVPGGLDSAYFAAGLASEPQFREVDGGRGYWIPDGRSLHPQPGGAESLPGGALLWEKGDVALLMRADVPKGEAIRIAESMR